MFCVLCSGSCAMYFVFVRVRGQCSCVVLCVRVVVLGSWLLLFGLGIVRVLCYGVLFSMRCSCSWYVLVFVFVSMFFAHVIVIVMNIVRWIALLVLLLTLGLVMCLALCYC